MHTEKPFIVVYDVDGHPKCSAQMEELQEHLRKQNYYMLETHFAVC